MPESSRIKPYVPETPSEEPSTEIERVYGWREHQLVAGGMELSRAHRLCVSDNWRVALDAMSVGCPEALAFEVAW